MQSTPVFRNRSNRVQIDASARFKNNIAFAPHLNGASQRVSRHIVQQNDIDPGHSKENAQLDLEYPPSSSTFHVRVRFLKSRDRRLQSVSRGFSQQVVILHHDHVIEPHAVIAAATCAHCRFFQMAPGRCCLACVQDAHRQAVHRIDIFSSKRGDARESLQEVEARSVQPKGWRESHP